MGLTLSLGLKRCPHGLQNKVKAACFTHFQGFSHLQPPFATVSPFSQTRSASITCTCSSGAPSTYPPSCRCHLGSDPTHSDSPSSDTPRPRKLAPLSRDPMDTGPQCTRCSSRSLHKWTCVRMSCCSSGGHGWDAPSSPHSAQSWGATAGVGWGQKAGAPSLLLSPSMHACVHMAR